MPYIEVYLEGITLVTYNLGVSKCHSLRNHKSIVH